MHSLARALSTWNTVFPSDNEYDIPFIRNNGRLPSALIAWGSRPKLLDVEEGSNMAVHFFLDDYRFESLWNRPAWSLDVLGHVGLALSPDFSLYRDMPVAMQIWQVYRNRWLGCFWQEHGIQVVPTISWSEPHDFCYYGVEPGSIVAVSPVGVQDMLARHLFRAGFQKMIDVLSPSAILSYGELIPIIGTMPDIPIVTFPTHWEQHKPRRSPRKIQLPIAI